MRMKYLTAKPQLLQLLCLLLSPALVLSGRVLESASAPTPAAVPGAMGGLPPGCPPQSMCGDITIPYPFSIIEGCSLNESFMISCNHSYNPPRPFYREYEVNNITPETGEMNVSAPVAHVCYNSSRTTANTEPRTYNFTGTPFLISPEKNEFTGIGCYTSRRRGVHGPWLLPDVCPDQPSVETSAIIFVIVVASVATIFLQTQKLRKLFNKNGGKILEAHGITIYTKTDLENMTKRYSKRLGGGHFGDVFEGTIDGTQAQQVAVKRSVEARVRRWQKIIRYPLPRNEQEDDGFVNEITFQFKIRHANVVQLLGCCLETEIPILVFEFVPNGSLEDLLHGDKNRTCTLSLLKRLEIAIGSAEALSHMHSQGDNTRVHGDVEPANILLDEDLKPKVSDFGSSKILSIDSYARAVAADRSYIDPAYLRTERFTVKSDVYSFGLVLLELITRKMAKYDGNKSLPLDFVKCCNKEGNGRTMYDMEMFSSEDAESHRYMECLDRMGTLAVRCLKEDVDERPTMAEVVEELKKVKTVAFGN